MGKTLQKMGRMSRREGAPLSTSNKALKVMQRRPYGPGVHGPAAARGGMGGGSRMSAYGRQLREKQKAKRLYGIMERQFRNYFEKSIRIKGNTAEILPRFLEMRLDNVVFRLGFAKTRPQARQMVSHCQFSINGETVNIPSYQVRVNDVIAIRENKKAKAVFNDLEERMKNHTVPGWLFMDLSKREGKVVSQPEGEDLKEVYDPKLIVEFYSR
ncbi:MAG: 30S ribosomal protein S4 [Patescibacteria group bacterium]|jgi:small subunit ribosomal protein S4